MFHWYKSVSPGMYFCGFEAFVVKFLYFPFRTIELISELLRDVP